MGYLKLMEMPESALVIANVAQVMGISVRTGETWRSECGRRGQLTWKDLNAGARVE